MSERVYGCNRGYCEAMEWSPPEEEEEEEEKEQEEEEEEQGGGGAGRGLFKGMRRVTFITNKD